MRSSSGRSRIRRRSSTSSSARLLSVGPRPPRQRPALDCGACVIANPADRWLDQQGVAMSHDGTVTKSDRERAGNRRRDLVLWFLGFAALPASGALIHVLLIVAVVVITAHFLGVGRSSATT